MGSYSPVEWVPDALVREVELTMVAPLVACLKRHGIQFRGTVFTGVMVVDDRPYCLEYNVRFGDPETQTLMRRLGSGFARALFE
ncbi:phosphoribosylamine--glycine ligase, partial [Acinetobacter baumannii]